MQSFYTKISMGGRTGTVPYQLTRSWTSQTVQLPRMRTVQQFNSRERELFNSSTLENANCSTVQLLRA